MDTVWPIAPSRRELPGSGGHHSPRITRKGRALFMRIHRFSGAFEPLESRVLMAGVLTTSAYYFQQADISGILSQISSGNLPEIQKWADTLKAKETTSSGTITKGTTNEANAFK